MAWIPGCPEELSGRLQNKILSLAAGWARSSQRPRVLPAVLDAWDELIEAWLQDFETPVYYRRSRDSRGERISLQGGRPGVAVDNSPAQWAYALALKGICPTLGEISVLQERDQIPVALALEKSEKGVATYKCCLPGRGNLNKRGWKLCHIEGVGLLERKETGELPIEKLEDRFRKLLSPRNMFVVPKDRSGLGELPEMIAAVRKENECPGKVTGKVLRLYDLLPLTFEVGIGGYGGSSFNVRLEGLSGRYSFREAFLEWREAGEGFEEKDRKTVTPSPEDWLQFWEELEATGAWNWKKSYEDDVIIMDGTSWGVEIKKPGRRKIDSGGSNAFPDEEEFKGFEKALRRLLGGLEFS